MCSVRDPMGIEEYRPFKTLLRSTAGLHIMFIMRHGLAGQLGGLCGKSHVIEYFRMTGESSIHAMTRPKESCVAL